MTNLEYIMGDIMIPIPINKWSDETIEFILNDIMYSINKEDSPSWYCITFTHLLDEKLKRIEENE